MLLFLSFFFIIITKSAHKNRLTLPIITEIVVNSIFQHRQSEKRDPLTNCKKKSLRHSPQLSRWGWIEIETLFHACFCALLKTGYNNVKIPHFSKEKRRRQFLPYKNSAPPLSVLLIPSLPPYIPRASQVLSSPALKHTGKLVNMLAQFFFLFFTSLSHSISLSLSLSLSSLFPSLLCLYLGFFSTIFSMGKKYKKLPVSQLKNGHLWQTGPKFQLP